MVVISHFKVYFLGSKLCGHWGTLNFLDKYVEKHLFGNIHTNITRKHTNRMRTVRCSGRRGGGGLSAQGGVSAHGGGGWCVCPGVCVYPSMH